jgi:hypothetical protein
MHRDARSCSTAHRFNGAGLDTGLRLDAGPEPRWHGWLMMVAIVAALVAGFWYAG